MKIQFILIFLFTHTLTHTHDFKQKIIPKRIFLKTFLIILSKKLNFTVLNIVNAFKFWMFLHDHQSNDIDCPVGWGCRIHRLLLCRGVRPPPMSVLYMTLNNLMVRFQQCWSFGECGVPLHCHRSQVHSGPEW